MNESCFVPSPATVQAISGGLVRLNLATRQWHAAVDSRWLELLHPAVTRADYVALLARTYGMVAPFESACRYTAGFAGAVDVSHLIRAGLLAHDLLALGMTPGQVAAVPTCPRITMFSSAVEALGWLYVVERTTLLADGLVRHVQHYLPQLADATLYLETFARRSSEQWRAFGQLVDRSCANASVARAIESAACHAFEIAAGWFDHAR